MGKACAIYSITARVGLSWRCWHRLNSDIWRIWKKGFAGRTLDPGGLEETSSCKEMGTYGRWIQPAMLNQRPQPIARTWLLLFPCSPAPLGPSPHHPCRVSKHVLYSASVHGIYYVHHIRTCRYWKPFLWSRLKWSAASTSRPFRCFSMRAARALLPLPLAAPASPASCTAVGRQSAFVQ